MDMFLRFLIYLVLGAGLLFFNALYVGSLVSAFRTDDTIILPVAIVGQEDKDGKVGVAIARMLAIRLRTLQAEIKSSQPWIAGDVEVFPAAAVTSEANPLDPVKIDAKVAGVDVGTVLPWIQNVLSRPHGVAFTLDFLDKDNALVTGDLRALAKNGRGVVSFRSSATHDKIVDGMAYAVLQARLESNVHEGVDSIDVNDFEQVVKGLGQVAAENQKASRHEIADWAASVNGISPVALKVPAWWELNYIAAEAARRMGDLNTAQTFYQAVKARAGLQDPPTRLVELVKSGKIDQGIEAVSKKEPSLEGFAIDNSTEAALARPKIEADIAEAIGLYEKLFSLQTPKPALKLLKDEKNAFWVSTENAIYAPAAVEYAPEVTYHEVAHSFITKVGTVDFQGEGGAIVESYADVCASWVSQKKSGQNASAADWTIGAGAVAALFGEGDPRQNRTALGSMKAPGTASKYDVQVDQYSKIPTDAGVAGVIYIAKGVPNKAFFETATRIGSTDTAVEIWIAAIPLLKPNATIPDLALATIAAARKTKGDAIAAKVKESWATVGLSEPDARAIPSRAGQP